MVVAYLMIKVLFLACLHAVKILKEMGVPLSKKIRFIVGANGRDRLESWDYYFNKKKIPAPQMSFTPDAVFPLIYAEKGVFQYQLVTDVSEDITLSGGNAFNAVADHASRPASSRTGNRDPQEPALLGDTDQMPFHSRKCGCIPPADRRRFCRTRSTSFYRNSMLISGLMSALSELSPENELARVATILYGAHRF